PPLNGPPARRGDLRALSKKASKKAGCSNVAAGREQAGPPVQAQPLLPSTGGVSAANIRTACGPDEAGLRAESAAARPDSSQGKTMPPSGLERSDKNDDQEEHDRLMAWLRAQQSSLPKCAEGYTRLAPAPRKR